MDRAEDEELSRKFALEAARDQAALDALLAAPVEADEIPEDQEGEENEEGEQGATAAAEDVRTPLVIEAAERAKGTSLTPMALMLTRISTVQPETLHLTVCTKHCSCLAAACAGGLWQMASCL
eukprot:SAG11_NODE_1366_length_5104_cov_3.710090_3_plen_123_part_00